MAKAKQKRALEAVPDEAPREAAPEAAVESAVESARVAETDDAAPPVTELGADVPETETMTVAETEAETAADPGADTASGPGLAQAPPLSVSEAHLESVLESLVFVADKPVTAVQLGRLVRAKSAEVKKILARLAESYHGRGIELVEVAGGWQFRSAAKNAPWVRDFVAQKPVRLTRAQLETLSIIGYRQPVTRPEVEEIRGVDSGSAMKVLLDRGLVKILGRKEEAGRPLLYGTTPQFLELFGMSSLKDLPTLREFSDLTDESRALFERKMGSPVGDLHEAAPEGDRAPESFDDDLAEEEAEAELSRPSDAPPPPDEEAEEEEEEAVRAASGEEDDGAESSAEPEREAAPEGEEDDDEDDDDDDDDDDDEDDEE